MNILIYTPVISGGGSERFAVVLSTGLANSGHEVTLLTGMPQANEYEVSPRVNRYCMESTRNIITTGWEIRKYAAQYAADVIIAIGILPNITLGLMKCMRMKTPVVMSERNAPKQDHLSRLSKMLRFLFFRFANAYVFQTPDAMAFYSKFIQKRGIVIPNPIREGLPFRSEKHKKEIVAVGRLMPQKNYPMLLKAFEIVCRENEEYILRIFGKGIYETELRKLAVSLGIENRVVFEGFSTNVHEAIKDSDIYVMSSDFEGLPNALMEAMAMGFPVVSTDCPAGGPRMLIEDGVNGLLVPIGDETAMAQAILRLINEPKEKDAMGAKATHISDTCNIGAIIQKWEELLKRTAAEY